MINSLKLIISVNRKEFVYSLVGSIFIALSWFFIQLSNSFLLKTVADLPFINDYIVNPFIIILFLYCIVRIPTVIGYFMNSLFAEKLVGRLDERLIAAWLYTPIYSQNKFSASDISTLLLNDCEDKINDFYFLGFTLKFVEPFLLGILSIFTLGLLYPGILLPFFLLGIPSVLCNIFFAKKISRYSRKYLSSFEEFVGCYNHALEYMNEIKICALNAVFKKKLEDTNKQIIRYEQEKEFTSINADFISHLWENFSLIMCVCLCLYLSLWHGFSSADITFVLTLSPLIFNFFYCFTNTWNYFIEISNSVERVYKTLEELPEINLKRSNTPLDTLQNANIYCLYNGVKTLALRRNL